MFLFVGFHQIAPLGPFFLNFNLFPDIWARFPCWRNGTMPTTQWKMKFSIMNLSYWGKQMAICLTDCHIKICWMATFLNILVCITNFSPWFFFLKSLLKVHSLSNFNKYFCLWGYKLDINKQVPVTFINLKSTTGKWFNLRYYYLTI